jgi:NADH dehydrogenase
MIARFRAVAVVGSLAASGLPAWLLWLLVRLTSLAGFKNRASVLFNWTVAFLGRGRAQRVISAEQVLARQALEVHARNAANEPTLSTAAHAEGAP